VSWPPTAAEFYLALNGRDRPPFQGDVYQDVLFTQARSGDTETSDPKPVEKSRVVATLSHPCDMVNPDGVTLSRCQAIALVRDGSKVGLPEDWEGAVTICPLPDLMGDGKLWVADFTLVSNVDRRYLTAERRVRCLSELGWAVFRQRAALALTRAKPSIEKLLEYGRVTWAESEMEMDWLAAGRGQADFQDWLNTHDEEHCPEVESRRGLLEVEGGIDRIWALLRSATGAGVPG
jgi:hypothetical protein